MSDQTQQGEPQAQPPRPASNVATIDPEARAAASIGAQVILDFNEAGSLGARGGAAPEMGGNVDARNEHLISLGLDPQSPSGPPPLASQLPTPPPEQEPQTPTLLPAGAGKATRVSSLAIGGQSAVQQPDDPRLQQPTYR